MKKVCIVGLGYIGLPTAAVLADAGYQIHGVDVNIKAVETINNGETHIYEPDLDKKVKVAVESGLLRASLEPKESDIFILAVPTPFKENHKPDLSYVESAAKSIAPFLQSGNIVVLESTSPVGTTEKVAEWIQQSRKDLNINDIYIAHCPERVLPGKILEELVSNDRIVGGINQKSTEKTAEFYRTFVEGEILKTNARTAEMSKLTENSFRDVNIAFANELSVICDELNINVWELIELANHHPRVNILKPGPGVGGHCIAVDPWFIVDSAPKSAKLINMARNINDEKPYYVVDKVKEAASSMENPIIACLGLSFKANIDDLRESPSVKIVECLSSLFNGKIYVSEPFIDSLPDNLINSNVELVSTKDAITKSNIILLLVDHDYFKAIDKISLVGKTIIDTKGIFKETSKSVFVTN